MRLLVSIDKRFLKARDGNIYSSNIFDYSFWERYLQVFDEVFVFARLGESPNRTFDRARSNGPNVFFLPVPLYLGPWQFLAKYRKLNSLAKQATRQADAFLLRVPAPMSSLVWRELKRRKMCYGVEVVGDPYDQLAPGSVKSVVRPFARKLSVRFLIQQCRYAAVASYVTERSLQQRYPPGNWSTYYSSIELPDNAIIESAAIHQRIERIRKRNANKPWRICYAGTMAQLYKAPDVLIDAVAQCLSDGLNVELVMLGDGQYRGQLEQQAKRLGISNRVRFPGMFPNGPALYEQLDLSDLYVLPSRQEGLPRSIIESMARGVPCIGSTVGGIGELLDADLMVQPNNPKELACKIKWLLNNPSRLETETQRGVEISKKYRASELNPRRRDFYQKLKEKTEEWQKTRRV